MGAERLVELRIERLSAGGDGVGRDAEGRVVFVPFTAPGDRVRVRLLEERPRYARGRVETLLEPSARRVDPVCPVFGSCGGCAWQHLAYGEQLRAKREIVEDALRRIGHVPYAGDIEVVASPEPYGYRHRTRLLRQAGRVGYRRRRSRRLQPVQRCPVLAPPLDDALRGLVRAEDVARGAREDATRAPHRPEGELELALGTEGPRVTPLGAGTSGSVAAPPVAGLPRAAPPVPAIWLEADGDALRISPGVFFQANASLHDALARAVLEEAGQGEHALELFAGAGFFTLRLSRRFTALTALEADPAAVADLRANLAAAGRENVRVLGLRLEEALAELPAADAVVLDPPRTGLAPGTAPAIAGLGAARIVYLSCDPATLARDLSDLVAGGYRLVRVRAFDLFPQTPHVEVLARLERADGRHPGGFVHSPG